MQSVRAQVAEAQKVAGGNGSEQDIAEAKIELEVRSFFGHVILNRMYADGLARFWRPCSLS